MAATRRIAVTGLGAVCPLGRSVDELFQNLLESRTSIRDVTGTYPWLSDYKTRIGSLFDGFCLDAAKIGLGPKEARRMDLFTQFALEAAYQAVHDSRILEYEPDETRERTGVAVGVGVGGIAEVERQKENCIRKGLNRVHPLVVPMIISDAAPGTIANHFGFHATESACMTAACASGAASIVAGYRSIRLCEADIMVCGGTEEAGAALVYAGFGNLGALTSNNDPDKASRPFDKDRDGFVPGEGAGMVVLEELEHARRRGARIYAELVGYGVTSDGWAEGMTSPRVDGKYAAKAITDALKRANINPEQVDYINTHGTSTPTNDPLETAAIKQALGSHAYKVSLNSTKSMLGHTLAAAGSLEAIVTIKTICEGIIHPTRNLDNPDPLCDLDYTKGDARDRTVRYALSNSFGFFGHNVVLALARYER